MKFKPHPGYEMLWNLHMDVENRAKGDETEFDRQLKKLFYFEYPKDMEIYDTKVPGINGAPDIPIRVYKNLNTENSPLVINIHGGGFISGDLNNDNVRCSQIAKNVPCTVISVEYRLSPQSIFPAALEDCYAVLQYAYNNSEEFKIDSKRIAVFGTSAGGCLAAALCLYTRDKNGPNISLQVLNFPALDYLANTTSALQYYEGTPLIQGKGLSKVWKHYLGGFDGSQPSYYAVPALARDLSDLPPACVITCEYDPLRDEGIDYARRLMEFAVPTELYCLPRVPHGFDLISAPLTEWIREGIYIAFRREFGML